MSQADFLKAKASQLAATKPVQVTDTYPPAVEEQHQVQEPVHKDILDKVQDKGLDKVQDKVPKDVQKTVQNKRLKSVPKQVHENSQEAEQGKLAVKLRKKPAMHQAHLLIPEDLYALAERAAKKNGLSVSELFRQLLEQAFQR